MWINLTKEQCELVKAAMTVAPDTHPAAQEIVREIDERLSTAFNPENEAWVQKAFDIHQDEGTLEVDQQSDGSAIVAHSEDGGAYVMAWVWVSNEAMGIEPADEDEDDPDYDDQGNLEAGVDH